MLMIASIGSDTEKANCILRGRSHQSGLNFPSAGFVS
jgi:hypothetical protein